MTRPRRSNRVSKSPPASDPSRAAGAAPSAPPHAVAWVTLTYALTTLLLAWPALAGEFLVTARSDQLTGGYSFRAFAAAWEKAHHAIPLWNSYLFGGMPYVAAMHGDTFYPTAILRLLVPVDVGMTWGLVIHVFLAGCFTYTFLRRAMGLDFFGALIGGIAYMIGGSLVAQVSPGNDGKLFIAALLPLTLFVVHRGVRDGRMWAWGALALTVTLDLLTPHPQLAQYLLLVAGAYGLFLAFSAPPAGAALPVRTGLARLAGAALAVAVGFLGSAVQYWSVIEYTPWSPRSGGKGWDHAVSFSMPPEEMINMYLPQFSGILDSYSGRNGIHFHSEYLGAAVLVLAGLAFSTRHVARRMVWFWVGTLVIAALWAMGGFTPFYHLVYTVVPGTKFFRAPSTILYVVSFCTAVLAAIGVDRGLTAGVRPNYAIAWIGAAVAVVLLAFSGALTALATTFSIPGYEEFAAANRGALQLGSLRSLAVVAATVGLLLAIQRGALRADVAGWLLAAVVALDLWSVERRYWGFSPPARELFASDPVIEYLKAIPEPGRVLPMATDPATSLTPARDPYLGSGSGVIDGLMVHGIRSATGYHGNELGRYDILTGLDGVHPVQLAEPSFWRLLNVRYLYTNDSSLRLPGAQRVAGPARNVAGNLISLYRLPGDNPPAWVASLAVAMPDSNALGYVLSPNFDTRLAAIFDTATTVPTVAIPQPLPAPSSVRVRVNTWEPGHIRLTLDQPAPAGSALVVSENYYPGWQATVDGSPAPTDRADYVLIGVTLPTGGREVELTYSSARYEQGRAMTIGAVLVAFVALIAGVGVERRQRARYPGSPLSRG